MTADELRAMLLDFARHVTVLTKHRDRDCAPEWCSKCEAERIIALMRVPA